MNQYSAKKDAVLAQKNSIMSNINSKKLRLDIEKAKKRQLEDLKEDYIDYINDREIERFLKIFSIIIAEEGPEEEPKDSEDGAIDIILTIANKISQLLEGDIGSLKLPKLLSKSLKTLKAIVGLLKVKNAKDKSNA